MLESAENSDIEKSFTETEYISFMNKNLLNKKVEKQINFQNKIIKNILILLIFLGIIIFLLNFLKVF